MIARHTYNGFDYKNGVVITDAIKFVEQHKEKLKIPLQREEDGNREEKGELTSYIGKENRYLDVLICKPEEIS
jgi:hypothetical protein